MRVHLSLLGVFVFHCGVSAQNLVVNPSFEEYTSCPDNIGQLDSVLGWEIIGRSPDYFNACADDTVSVPYNALGYQWPSEGAGYVGLFTGPCCQEYIQSQLTADVEPGQLTYVSIRIAAGGFGYPFWTSPMLAGSNVGMHLSTGPWAPLTVDGEFNVNFAAVHMVDVLSDTSDWILLSAAFVADSAYRFVQIGNFFADSLSTFAPLDQTPGGTEIAYAFVDEVCVSQDPGICAGWNSIEQFAYPDPPSTAILFSDWLTIPLASWGLDRTAADFELMDATGRLVAQTHNVVQTSSLFWDLSDQPSGSYYLRIRSDAQPTFCVRSWKIVP